jgi:hypothetical protein
VSDKRQEYRDSKPENIVGGKQVLSDKNVYPDNAVIERLIGADHFGIYLRFLEKIEALNLVVEWRYYNRLLAKLK